MSPGLGAFRYDFCSGFPAFRSVRAHEQDDADAQGHDRNGSEGQFQELGGNDQDSKGKEWCPTQSGDYLPVPLLYSWRRLQLGSCMISPPLSADS